MTTMRVVLGLSMLLVLMAACGSPEPAPSPIPGGQKVADLLAAGACPLQVAAVLKGANPVGGSFVVKLRNRSDSPVGAIKWGAVALDASGNALLDGISEGAYDEDPIPPGETIEGMLTITQEDAASVRVVVKSLLWYTPNPLGGDEPPLPHVWRNPMYDIQLHSAQGVPVED
jgi:hypothetical protein